MNTAIIIGATSGIGREIASRLADEGWSVGIAGRRAEALEEFRSEYGAERVSVAQLDVTDENSIAALETLLAETGAPDLFFYVSGVGYQNRELALDQEIRTVRTNCEGMVRMVDYFMGYVRRHPESYDKTRKAHIAVITSIAGTAGMGTAPAYSATKKMQQTYISALVQLSRMEKIPVRFTDIRPGFVATNLLNPVKRYPMTLSTEKAASCVMKALRRRKRVCVFDWRWSVVVFFWQLIPRSLWEKITFVKN